MVSPCLLFCISVSIILKCPILLFVFQALCQLLLQHHISRISIYACSSLCALYILSKPLIIFSVDSFNLLEPKTLLLPTVIQTATSTPLCHLFLTFSSAYWYLSSCWLRLMVETLSQIWLMLILESWNWMKGEIEHRTGLRSLRVQYWVRGHSTGLWLQ